MFYSLYSSEVFISQFLCILLTRSYKYRYQNSSLNALNCSALFLLLHVQPNTLHITLPYFFQPALNPNDSRTLSGNIRALKYSLQ